VRTRLHKKYTARELAELYPVPHDHVFWEEHIKRVDYTIALLQEYLSRNICVSAADLSCGNGAILRSLDIETKFFGDYAEGYAYQGSIEFTINQIPDVDLFVCSETLEHLDNPDRVLKQIRKKAKHLVLSTPIDETAPSENYEHYWGWGSSDVGGMLLAAGWDVCKFHQLDCDYYSYQIWLCS